jgi:hypothetical protein
VGDLVADDAVAAGRALVLLILGVGAVLRVVAAARAATVEEDTLALAGDAVSLAGAGAAVGGGGAVAGELRAGRGAVGAVRDGRAGGGSGRRDVHVVVETGSAEAGGELVHGLGVVVVGVQDVLGGVGRHGLGGLDLRDGQGAALGDLERERRAGRLGGALAAGLGGRLGGRLGGGLGRGLGRRRLGGRLGGRLARLGGDIEDVQLTAGGGLDGGVDAGVVGNVVAIDDEVVPVSLASLERRVLEAKGTLPRAGLGRGLVLGEGELANVVVPRAQEVDGLDTGGEADGERLLNSRHYC